MSLPEGLKEEQAAVEAEIRRAFAGVTREGGVSWSEAVAIDGYEILETREAARAKDKEASWEELVEDPEWNPDRGVGGFTFLDPIGFRYYIAPAMIRWSRGLFGDVDGIHVLEVGATRDEARVDIVNQEQGEAIARFIRFMLKMSQGDAIREMCDTDLRRSYECYWGRWYGGTVERGQ